MNELFGAYGINLQALIGGSAGGIVFCLVVGVRQPIEVLIAWVVGALTANYMTPYVAPKIGLEEFIGTASFVVGGGAKYIVQIVLDKFKQWAPGLFPASDPGGGK